MVFLRHLELSALTDHSQDRVLCSAALGGYRDKGADLLTCSSLQDLSLLVNIFVVGILDDVFVFKALHDLRLFTHYILSEGVNSQGWGFAASPIEARPPPQPFPIARP
jgi:hypothetical protein